MRGSSTEIYWTQAYKLTDIKRTDVLKVNNSKSSSVCEENGGLNELTENKNYILCKIISFDFHVFCR